MKRGSGKQVVNKILYALSTKLINNKELSLATQKLRAGLLLHGSTSEENFELVSKLVWSSSHHDDTGKVWRQGIALKNGNIFVSDIFETIIENETLKESVMKEYPELSSMDYDAAMFAIWLVISSVQMFTELLPC
ncbi:hypothetical protein BGS_1354 [Beggiatoa sp. SS]|nr:hypothetical protein BGS_1354 [Beggiatoa sp. SS]